MAEYYPGQNPDYESNGPEGSKRATGKSGSRFETPKVEKSAGYETLKFGEGLKPLSEIFKPETVSKPAAPELPKEIKEIKPAEVQEGLHEVSAEELRARAAQDAAEQLARHQRAMFSKSETEESSEEDDEDSEADAPRVVKHQTRPAREAEDTPEQPAPLLDHEVPAAAEHAEAPHNESEPLGPEPERSPHHSLETEAAFAAIAAAPEMADLAAKKLPEAPGVPLEEQARPEAFSDWVQNEHPEQDTPEMAASHDDDGFNDIVRNSIGGRPPGETRYFERAPGEPPADAGAGHNQPPNFPPTAEGGAWGNGDYPNRNYNPNVLNNPWVPAGGLTEPATWAAISALGARQEYLNLKNRAEHGGLAAAVVLLGIGHFRNRRKINRQGREIRQQGKQLQHEQAAHSATRSRLEQVSATQNAAAESQVQPSREAPKINRPETGYFSAPIPTSAKAEGAPAAQPALKSEQVNQLNKQELNWYLENNREAGRAIEKNPELRDTFEAAAAVPNGERLDSGKSNEQPVFNQEGTHEQLRNQYLDNAGGKRAATGTDAGMVPLPTTQPAYIASTFQQPQPRNQGVENQLAAKSSAAKPIAAGAVLFVVIIILIFIFSR